MYTISKEFHFSASHQLDHLPEGHQCARLHGHNYIMVVELSGSRLDRVGFILDYGELGIVKDIVDGFDHRHLNDFFTFNPTSENICRFVYEEVERILKENLGHKIDHIDDMGIGLSETPKTMAWYRRGLV
jgi:6-pyruvoyltetrahydropterin/6-carboxytetrahydropterin synthase